MGNQDTRYRLCQMLSKHVERWTWTVLKEKAIYHSLNQFKADVQGMLRGEGWIVRTALEDARGAVNRAHASMDMAMPSLVDLVPKPWPTPPTHFETNKFTYGYQEFVNTYGIPRYREANPALFTAATFPFLFGVMYGDIGHGMFLFVAGLFLLWNEKANEEAKLGEMMAGMHSGRYMMTMMGACAVYAGVVYNDCFSLGINIFGSKWVYDGQDDLEVEEGTVAELTGAYEVYPFGLDPAWHVASNELLFFNSFKMKISVVFGIFQMFMGTCLRGINAVFFKEWLDLFFEFVPMVMFACSLFMYMVVLIFMKWSIDWKSRMLGATCLAYGGDGWDSEDYTHPDGWQDCDDTYGTGYCTPSGISCALDGSQATVDLCALDYGGTGDGCQPPNLITTLINIALSPGSCVNQCMRDRLVFRIFFLPLPLSLYQSCSVPSLTSFPRDMVVVDTVMVTVRRLTLVKSSSTRPLKPLSLCLIWFPIQHHISVSGPCPLPTLNLPLCFGPRLCFLLCK